MARRTLRVGVSIVLAVILLVFFLYNVDMAEVGRSIGEANLLLIAASTLAALLSYWMRAVRWQLILRSAGRTRHSSAVLSVAVGYAAMALLPARAGDLVRPLALSRRDRVPFSAALASMVTERLFDLMTVVLFFLIFTIWPPAMAALGEDARESLRLLQVSGWVAGGGLVVLVAILLLLFRFQGRFVEIVCRPIARMKASWRQPMTDFLNHALDGLRVLQRPRDLAVTVIGSILLWFVIFWQVQLSLLAFDVHLPLRASFLLVALSVIGLAIPTPGGVGGFHKATQVGLTVFFGVELNRATAIAIAHHAVCFLPITIIGLLCLPLLGMSLSDASGVPAETGEVEAP